MNNLNLLRFPNATKAILAAITFFVLASPSFATPNTGNSYPGIKPIQYNPVVGAWRILVTPDGQQQGFVNYANFTSDFLIVGSDTGGLVSTGTYRQKGRYGYIGQFVGACGDCNGAPLNSYFQINIDVELSRDKRELHGRFVTRLISPQGEIISEFTGDAYGTKLGIDSSMLP